MYYCSVLLWFSVTMVPCSYGSLLLWFPVTTVLCYYGSLLLWFPVTFQLFFHLQSMIVTWRRMWVLKPRGTSGKYYSLCLLWVCVYWCKHICFSLSPNMLVFECWSLSLSLCPSQFRLTVTPRDLWTKNVQEQMHRCVGCPGWYFDTWNITSTSPSSLPSSLPSPLPPSVPHLPPSLTSLTSLPHCTDAGRVWIPSQRNIYAGVFHERPPWTPLPLRHCRNSLSWWVEHYCGRALYRVSL